MDRHQTGFSRRNIGDDGALLDRCFHRSLSGKVSSSSSEFHMDNWGPRRFRRKAAVGGLKQYSEGHTIRA